MSGMSGISGSLARPAHERIGLDDARAREFEAFVALHRDRAISLAWRLVGPEGIEAEEVAQDAFVRAYRALGGFRGEAQMSTWFYRILVNEAWRHRRWRWIRQRLSAEMPEDVPDPRPGAAGDPALRHRIGRALDLLPRGQREAFLLVHLEGFSATEAAAITGRATGTIKSHLHRALRALRANLEDLDPKQESPSS